MNQLPADPAWVKKCDEVAKAAARDLGCMVILVAIQPEGKLGVCVEGVPESGPLHEAAKDVPQMLAGLALATRMQDDFLRANPSH